jgi:hypothetical protein
LKLTAVPAFTVSGVGLKKNVHVVVPPLPYPPPLVVQPSALPTASICPLCPPFGPFIGAVLELQAAAASTPVTAAAIA